MASDDGGVPLGLQDPNNIPSELLRKARNRLQNYNYQQQFGPYRVPSAYYDVYHIHRYTELNVMDVIIKHFEGCEKITLDSESVNQPSKLALI
ncbi:unnamed protein product [Adineta steineri]|uniref:Uncharacterized protein n=1 Tax=Adineta steineri TaxID=433720 RepID=A0A819FL96_9BILA|nr:unnamed protein product [Adineta steineri]CAF3870982.1 unnamed protein product [Adineta steineri]